MYEEWTEPKNWQGHPVLFVAMHKKDIRKNKLKQFTDSMQPVEEHVLHSDNRKVRTLLLRRASSYQPQL
jgi:hypothetical protein